MLVLVIEDDRDLAANVLQYLELGGIDCDYAERGDHGLTLIEENARACAEERYDAIILDIQLPGIDGFRLCHEIRDKSINTPVLMLTARDSLPDKLEGFDAGADDYLVKPFELPELEARLKAVCKRPHALNRSNTLKYQLGDLLVDEASRSISRSGQNIQIPHACWLILLELLKDSPNVVKKERLEYILWPDKPANPESLKAHLYSLRKAIDGNHEEKLIHTLRNVGVSIKMRSQEQ